jgi:hypothetical protein
MNISRGPPTETGSCAPRNARSWGAIFAKTNPTSLAQTGKQKVQATVSAASRGGIRRFRCANSANSANRSGAGAPMRVDVRKRTPRATLNPSGHNSCNPPSLCSRGGSRRFWWPRFCIGSQRPTARRFCTNEPTDEKRKECNAVSDRSGPHRTSRLHGNENSSISNRGR